MKKQFEQLTEWLGWYGVLAILLAYGLLSFSVIRSNGLVYQLLNLTGGLGILIDAYADKNYQPVVLNAIWILIALFAIVNIVI